MVAVLAADAVGREYHAAREVFGLGPLQLSLMLHMTLVDDRADGKGAGGEMTGDAFFCSRHTPGPVHQFRQTACAYYGFSR